jgi:hypothetical protein
MSTRQPGSYRGEPPRKGLFEFGEIDIGHLRDDSGHAEFRLHGGVVR